MSSPQRSPSVGIVGSAGAEPRRGTGQPSPARPYARFPLWTILVGIVAVQAAIAWAGLAALP